MQYFNTLLIANRGEIAVRIIRACRALGIEAVAVYSDADERALHVREADRAVRIGPAAAVQSYLNIPAIIAAAQHVGAEAIHPGYGFLSENAAFARACAEANIVFVGPPAAAIDLMGSKIAAKRLASQAGVPIVPGYSGDDQSEQQLRAEAQQIGYPLLIKASAGGGGKGMRAVHHDSDFGDALAGAKREALAAFGDDRVLLERLIERPRHIEMQIIADAHGNVVHLGERECSIQRRHQKVVEESPSVALTPERRAEMGAAAVRLAQAVDYRNAGTLEFVFDQAGNFYFLEMNTRLQVEHPVTELVTGIDLVQTQIGVAAGQPLPWTQEQIEQHGHAIEVRLYAENPITMLPATGMLTRYEPPQGPGVRLDTGVSAGDVVGVHYDPMLAKLIVWGEDRAQAVARLSYALATFTIAGVTTNLPLLRAIVRHPDFAAGNTFTDFLQVHSIGAELVQPAVLPDGVIVARALFELMPTAELPADPWAMPWRATQTAHSLRYCVSDADVDVQATPVGNRTWQISIGDQAITATVLRRHHDRLTLRIDERIHRALLIDGGVQWDGEHYALDPARPPSVEALAAGSGAHGHANLESPMPGTIIKVLVSEGQTVEQGQPLLILEAMKMEHTIAAPYAGTVARLPYAEGAQVSGGAMLIELDEMGE